MEFSVNVNLTASPELLGAVNRLADAIMGFRPNLIKQEQEQTNTTKVDVKSEVSKKVEPLETAAAEPEVMNEETIAPQEAEEMPTENTRIEGTDYVETELMEFPVVRLTEILKGYGINPKDHEGLNTNRKLRLLVLAAQKMAKGAATKESEIQTIEAAILPANEVKEESHTVSLETARALFVQKIQAGKRSECKALLEKYDCASVTELGETEHVETFYNDLLKL